MGKTAFPTQILRAIALRIGLGIPIIALFVLLPVERWFDWRGWNAASARKNSA